MFGLLVAFSGCAALTSAKGSADSAKGAADDAKGQKDSAQQPVKDEKDKGKGDKAGGGGGAAGPTRLEATDGQINVPISDKIDAKKNKTNDWRKFALAGKAGQFATFELHWDEEAANLEIDVFDKFGVNIGKIPRRIEGQSSKKVLLRIDDPGVYYVRVSGPTKADSSIYTMRVKYNGAGGRRGARTGAGARAGTALRSPAAPQPRRRQRRARRGRPARRRPTRTRSTARSCRWCARAAPSRSISTKARPISSAPA